MQFKKNDSIMGRVFPEGGVADEAKTGKTKNKNFISDCFKE